MTTNNKYTLQPENYYRCAFPRGRMLSKLEDDLTVFAQLIMQKSHCPKHDFNVAFDAEYSKLHNLDDKTVKNHRTEMIRLYGLVTTTPDGLIEPSKMCRILSETQDFFLFFKLFCLKFQFPNGVNKPQNTAEQIEKGIRFKPAKFILELMNIGVKKHGWDFCISSGEVSSLVFNDVRVTSGLISPEVCMDILTANRRDKIIYEGGSKVNQHGREFLGYMRLANLLTVSDNDRYFCLNRHEKNAIDYILGDNRFFEINSNFDEDHTTILQTQTLWESWYGDITDEDIKALTTKPQMLEDLVKEVVPQSKGQSKEMASPTDSSMKDIGDLGEIIALKFEKDMIGKIRPDKIHLVQRVSNDTILGFDIQSFEFENPDKKKFIEVKTTNRTYPPDIEVLTSFYMSSNEWQTAQNYLDSYYIYRVFLLGKVTKIFVVKNPTEKEKQGLLILEPTNFRVILKQGCGDYIT